MLSAVGLLVARFCGWYHHIGLALLMFDRTAILGMSGTIATFGLSHLDSLFGWEANFWMIGGVGVLIWIITFFDQGETVPPNKNVSPGVKLTIKFSSIVAKENIYGVQFHPEKSSSQGLNLIKKFMST